MEPEKPSDSLHQDKTAGRKKLSPKAKAEIKSYSLILLSNVIRAIAVHYFVLSYNFAPGGVTGIATMLYYGTGYNAGYFLIALNAPLIILSFFFFSKNYAFKTMIGLLLGSGLLIVLDKFDEMLSVKAGFDIMSKLSVGDQTILAAIAGGMLSGIALSMVIKAGGSNGGTEIIGGIIQQKMPQFNVSFLISILDSSVILASFFVYSNGLAAVLLALVQVFCYSKVSDIILSGFKSAVKIEIVTNKPEELGKEIIEKLGRGVTTINAMGMYSHLQRYLLVSVIRKRQLPDLYKLLKAYPDAFAYIISASEVIGTGFSPLPGSRPKNVKIVGVRAHLNFKNAKNIRKTKTGSNELPKMKK